VHRIANVSKPTFFTVDVVDPISGPVGPTGPVGPRGFVGDTGATGPTGPQGAVGPMGPQGIVGPLGPMGAVGATGAIGPPGINGATGATGAGSTGATGPSGRDGASGPPGGAGPSGPTGVGGSVGPPGPAGGSDAPCRRFYYLTPGSYQGDHALTACDSGYHMACIAELPIGNNLVYDTARGFQLADSGYGPPVQHTYSDISEVTPLVGWIRTGGIAMGSPSDTRYLPNCNAWTSTNRDFGIVRAAPVLESAGGSREESCFTLQHVWCIQD
jgi:hypothetical protein